MEYSQIKFQKCDQSQAKQFEKQQNEKSKQQKKFMFGQYYQFDEQPESKLGQGSFGKVFKGKKTTIKKGNDKAKNLLPEQIAIKVMLKNFSQIRSDQLINIVRQINSLEELKSPGIVQMIGFQIVEYNDLKSIGIGMQLMDGTLQKILKQKNGEGIPEPEAVAIMQEIVNSYRYIQQKSQIQKKSGQFSDIIHRDLKPDNIFYKIEDGKRIFKIGDLGIVRNHRGLQAPMTINRGTESYSSPQQTSKKGFKYTNKADVYAIGVIFFQLLNGRGKRPDKVPQPQCCVDYDNDKKLNEDLTRQTLKKLKVSVSDTVINFIINCLKKNESQRYSWKDIFKNQIFAGYLQKNVNSQKNTVDIRFIKFNKYYQFDTKNKLGQGSFGEVFKGYKINGQKTNIANDLPETVAIKLPETVAIKVVYHYLIERQKLQNHLLNIGILEEINSQGIVNMHKYQIINYNGSNTIAIAMQLMDGTLQQLMKKQYQQKPIPESEAIDILHGIVKSYKWIYEKSQQKKGLNKTGQDIIHKDLKPSNIFYKNEENGKRVFKIGDLGFARNQKGQKTMTKYLGFSQEYCSFQQISRKKNKKFTNKADVYAIGVIFFQLLNGQRKIPSQTSAQQQYCVDPDSYMLNQSITKRVLKQLKISNFTINFIINCLQKQQEQRYSWKDIFQHQIFEHQIFEFGHKNLSGLKHYEQILTLQRSKGEQSIETAIILNNIGNVYEGLEDYKNALKYYEQCLEIQQKIKGEGSIDTASTLNNIGNVYKDLGDYKNALKYYKQCLEIQQKIKGEGSIDTASTLYIIGTVYFNLEKYKSAKQSFEQSLKYFKTNNVEGSRMSQFSSKIQIAILGCSLGLVSTISLYEQKNQKQEQIDSIISENSILQQGKNQSNNQLKKYF